MSNRERTPEPSAKRQKLRRRAADIDQARLQEFLRLVDCEPWEVKEIPPGRLLSTAELKAECARVDPDALRKSLGEMEVHFGQHKGKTLKDVPLSYLNWVLSVQGAQGSFRRFQRKVGQFLGREDGGGSR